VRHNQDYCYDCYENEEEHEAATGELLCYTVGGYSYLIPLKDYDRWLRLLFENRHAHIFKQISLFFQATNAPFCEIWFVEESDDN
jgi:hypothetical protein